MNDNISRSTIFRNKMKMKAEKRKESGVYFYLSRPGSCPDVLRPGDRDARRTDRGRRNTGGDH